MDATTSGSTLVKTSDVLGSDILDGASHKIASIRELFIDPVSGRVEFAVAEISTLLGSGGKFHPIPWGLLSWNAARSGYDVSFDKDRLKASPAYDREQINSTAYGWDAQVRSYFGG